MLSSFIYIIHVIICVCIVALVLFQHGKGADAGAAFGSGSSGTVFGAAGKGNFLATLTKIFVGLFFLSCLFMMFNANRLHNEKSVIDKAFATEVPVSEATGAEMPANVEVPSPSANVPETAVESESK